MDTRLNEAQEMETQELYDMYNDSEYDGDGDAYEDWPEDWPDDLSEDCSADSIEQWLKDCPANLPEDSLNDDSYASEDIDDASFSSKNRSSRSMWRRNSSRAKRKLFMTAEIVSLNSRARLSHADRYPKAPIPKYQVAKRILSTAKKMGMEI